MVSDPLSLATAILSCMVVDNELTFNLLVLSLVGSKTSSWWYLLIGDDKYYLEKRFWFMRLQLHSTKSKSIFSYTYSYS